MLMEEKGKCKESCYVEEVSSVMVSQIQTLGEQKGHGIYIEAECLIKIHSLILDTNQESIKSARIIPCTIFWLSNKHSFLFCTLQVTARICLQSCPWLSFSLGSTGISR